MTTSDASQLRILLVDDDIMNRKIVTNMVSRLGHLAEAVESGLEALKQLVEKHYDLVLMDCQMPELDGYETTALIRSPLSKALNPSIPIIALTADVLSATKEACFSAGMDDYLSKPLQIRCLEEMLTRWAQN